MIALVTIAAGAGCGSAQKESDGAIWERPYAFWGDRVDLAGRTAPLDRSRPQATAAVLWWVADGTVGGREAVGDRPRLPEAAAIWWVAGSSGRVGEPSGVRAMQGAVAPYDVRAVLWVADGSPMYMPAGMGEVRRGATVPLRGWDVASVPSELHRNEGVDGWIEGRATHYGESYNGLPLGCGTGDYRSENPRIVAVSPARYVEWPCGTRFEICGDRGCIEGERHDACPGCGRDHLDLSEAGIAAVCGEVGTCAIRFRIVEESVTP